MITSAYEVREFYKINRPEIIQAGNAVNRLTEKNSLVIAAYNGDTAFLYQTGRIGWPVVDRPIDELIEKDNDKVDTTLDDKEIKELALKKLGKDATEEEIEVFKEQFLKEREKDKKFEN